MTTRIRNCFGSQRGVWYFRTAIPRSVCERIGYAQRELRRSLQTTNVTLDGVHTSRQLVEQPDFFLVLEDSADGSLHGPHPDQLQHRR